MNLSKGNSYFGGVQDSLFHGWGVFKEKKYGFEIIYEGNFLNGMKHGHGSCVKKCLRRKTIETESFIDGMWHKDEHVGYFIEFMGQLIK